MILLASVSSGGGKYLRQGYEDGTRRKVEYHLHKGDGLEKLKMSAEGSGIQQDGGQSIFYHEKK